MKGEATGRRSGLTGWRRGQRCRHEEWFNGAYRASGRRCSAALAPTYSLKSSESLYKGLAGGGEADRERISGRRRKIFPKDVNTNEAKSLPLGGWSEAPHGARWRRRRPYGGRWWRRDTTQGRLTWLGPGTDRGGSRAGAPGTTPDTTAPGTLRHGVLRVGSAAARRGALRIVPRGTRARR